LTSYHLDGEPGTPSSISRSSSSISRSSSLPSFRQFGATLMESANRLGVRKIYIRDEGHSTPHSDPSIPMIPTRYGDNTALPPPENLTRSTESNPGKSSSRLSIHLALNMHFFACILGTPPHADGKAWKIVSVTSDLDDDVGNENNAPHHHRPDITQTESADIVSPSCHPLLFSPFLSSLSLCL